MKKYYPFIVFFALVALIFFSYRGIYLARFDGAYSRDLYDHSQWVLPLAVRSISDNLLYKVAGHDLLKTGKLFEIAPEVPPLGKYLYGFSIRLFQNGELASALLFIFSILIFNQLLKKIFPDNKKIIFLGVLLFILEPLIFSHSSYTMLDLPQLLVILVHVLSILILYESKKINWFSVLVAGLSLGAFISIKIGFFVIAIIFSDLIILYRCKKLRSLPIILVLSLIFYVSTYSPYFHSHSFIDFLKSQKWMIKFYLSSKAKPIWGMIIISGLTGYYRGWSYMAAWDRFPEWSILWILYFLAFVLSAFSLFKKQEKDQKIIYIFNLAFCLICLNLFITFWTRYLLLIIPLLIILFLRIFASKFNKKTIIVLVCFALVQSLIFINGSLRYDFKGIKENWEKGSYQELYEYLDKESKAKISRFDFWRSMQQFDRQLSYPKRTVTAKFPIFSPLLSKTEGDFNINYETEIGTFDNKEKIQFRKEDGIWKIHWDNNLVLLGFGHGKAFFTLTPQKYYALKLKNGTILSQGGMSSQVLVQINKIKDENKLQQQVYCLTGLKKYTQEFLYKANNQVDWEYPIGFFSDVVDPTKCNFNQLDPGIIIKEGYTRLYNKDYVKKKKIDGIRLIVQKYYSVLNPKAGGTIGFIGDDGSVRVLISRQAAKGKDIILSSF